MRVWVEMFREPSEDVTVLTNLLRLILCKTLFDVVPSESVDFEVHFERPTRFGAVYEPLESPDFLPFRYAVARYFPFG
jgi:hypothetical protein